MTDTDWPNMDFYSEELNPQKRLKDSYLEELKEMMGDALTDDERDMFE